MLKSVFSNSFNQDLLGDLSCDEASEIFGGFSLKNETDRTQTFYPFASNIERQRQVLQPGESNNYKGNFVDYNSSRSGYIPVLASVDPNGSYHFITQGDMTRLVGINEFTT
ncbi:MAG: hypothetical protein RMX96_22665 [Nostoc sp. ChiSLP02]|nr:hypothetical protein [Nostoc sp. DedSLP05]MDZ8099965.1 hypothetical protein [Nostoc sp. DedSLP01]MDZ8187640.1 hypothetical protein [Nostoc sp. ChiSLP02]